MTVEMPEEIIVAKVDDTPDALARLARVLEDENVEVRGLAACPAADGGGVALLAGDARKAFETLREGGFAVEAHKALAVMASPDGGEVGRVLGRIARAGVRMPAAVSTREGHLVVAVDDYARAHDAVGGSAVEKPRLG